MPAHLYILVSNETTLSITYINRMIKNSQCIVTQTAFCNVKLEADDTVSVHVSVVLRFFIVVVTKLSTSVISEPTWAKSEAHIIDGISHIIFTEFWVVPVASLLKAETIKSIMPE